MKIKIPQEKLFKKKGMMYEEKWGEIVSDWLFEDYKIKEKVQKDKEANV